RVTARRREVAPGVRSPRAIPDLEREGGFRKHLRSFDDYEELATDLRKRFKFVGDSGIYHFLWTVSHPVPDWHDWAKAHGIEWRDKTTPKGSAPRKAGPKRTSTAKPKTTRRRPAAR